MVKSYITAYEKGSKYCIKLNEYHQSSNIVITVTKITISYNQPNNIISMKDVSTVELALWPTKYT